MGAQVQSEVKCFRGCFSYLENNQTPKKNDLSTEVEYGFQGFQREETQPDETQPDETQPDETQPDETQLAVPSSPIGVEPGRGRAHSPIQLGVIQHTVIRLIVIRPVVVRLVVIRLVVDPVSLLPLYDGTGLVNRQGGSVDT
jgi:hypothetical protein